MYYYGYNGYGSSNCCPNMYQSYGYPAGSNGYGYGAAIILVLFILLFGAGFLNYGNN